MSDNKSRGGTGLRLIAIGCALLVTLDNARAQDEAQGAKVLLADGRVLAAPLRAITAGEVHLEDRAPLAAADVVRIDFPGHARQAAQRATLIKLVNGDRIMAGLTSMSDDAVTALWKSHPDWSPVRIPSETVAGILLSAPSEARERAHWFSQVFGRRAKSDVVLFLNGDRAAGDLVSFDQTNLKLSQGNKPLSIEMARIRGIAFNAGLSNLSAPRKPRILVTFTGGSQLTGSGASRERGGPLRLTTSFGAALEVPLSAVTSIRFLDGRATYLSDLEPKVAQATGFFGSAERTALGTDRNVLGGPLVLQGHEYPKGLGTRSKSRLEFDLAGGYRTFRATAGLDDLAQGKGSVRFLVERDGTRIFESGLVTGASAPLAIGPLDVTGAQRLTLIVDYGELADIDDWADWCDAVVIR